MMSKIDKIIVCVSKNPPTEAVKKFASFKGWRLLMVLDEHIEPGTFDDVDCIALYAREQKVLYPKLSELIGWKTPLRRNIGLLRAYELGARVVASVDDDNMPVSTWGQDLAVGRRMKIKTYVPQDPRRCPFFDPLFVTNNGHLWHRGFPLEYVGARSWTVSKDVVYEECDVHVQANLWNGDPDVDAIARRIFSKSPDYALDVSFEPQGYYRSPLVSPFDAQNTFLTRDALRHFLQIGPGIGRMEDIWASYVVQMAIKQGSVVYGDATVRQERSGHTFVGDLKGEMIGIESTMAFLHNAWPWPPRAQQVRGEWYDAIKAMDVVQAAVEDAT